MKTEPMSGEPGFFKRVQNYIFAGILTVIPLWITWFVFTFILQALSKLGKPLVDMFILATQDDWPLIGDFLQPAVFHSALAVVATLVLLYLLGWLATKVIGGQILRLFDYFMYRIPFVEKVYGSVRKLVTSLQQKPDGVQRVVLIAFPNTSMKTVGFVTKTMVDEATGQELAAVYVPTTPNPTSGYLEILPVDQLTETHWSMDEAMSFVISGGTVAPEKIRFNG